MLACAMRPDKVRHSILGMNLLIHLPGINGLEDESDKYESVQRG